MNWEMWSATTIELKKDMEYMLERQNPHLTYVYNKYSNLNAC